MATDKQVEEVLRAFSSSSQAQDFRGQHINMSHININMQDAGMFGVLGLLSRSSAPLTAGDVSKELGVSTARVAVLIRKMVEKKLIRKEASASDARIVELKLAPHGREVLEEIQKQRTAQLKLLIDKIGMERLMEYIEISKEIRTIAEPFSVEL